MLVKVAVCTLDESCNRARVLNAAHSHRCRRGGLPLRYMSQAFGAVVLYSSGVSSGFFGLLLSNFGIFWASQHRAFLSPQVA